MTAPSEKNMLSKLQVKFTAIICGVSALILVASFGYIAWSNHTQKINFVYNELNAALESTATKEPPNLPEQNTNTTPPRIGENREGSQSFPVALYSVSQSDTTPSIQVLSGYSTAVISEETLEIVVQEVLAGETTQGFLPNSGLYYKKVTLKDGVVHMAFADQGVIDNGVFLVRPLVIAGIIIELVIFALAWAFSRWALRPVQRAWESQQQFIADASHEMKTPLTVIMANASIALKKPQASIAEQSQWIEGIQDEAQNMEHLVLDMLALAQPESSPAQKNAQEPVNFSEMAERASLQFEALAFERGVTLEQHIQPNIVVKGDAAKLQRLIGTLIDNACKYAAKQTSINVTLQAAGAQCTLAVHNWGSPIDPNDIPHVFDRFYRSDKSRDRSNADGEHSFGLGLAIAQKIVHEHHGSLTVTSTEVAGTTFMARLPRV